MARSLLHSSRYAGHVIESEPAVVGLTFGVELRAASEPAFVPAQLGRRLGEVLPVAGKSDVQLCEELQLVSALESMLAGYKAELVIALAGQRPAEEDVSFGSTWGAGEVRLPETSEFFCDELAHVLRCSRRGGGGVALHPNRPVPPLGGA